MRPQLLRLHEEKRGCGKHHNEVVLSAMALLVDVIYEVSVFSFQYFIDQYRHKTYSQNR